MKIFVKKLQENSEKTQLTSPSHSKNKQGQFAT